MGKTALGRSIAVNVAAGLGISQDGEVIDDPDVGRPVAYFALEEPDVDFGAAIIAQIAGVPLGVTLSGDLSIGEGDRLAAAQRRLNDTPLEIFDRPRQTVVQIAAAARRFSRARKGLLGAVVVDYLQLIPMPAGQRDYRLGIGQNAYALKALAKELGCAIILLSQLSRDVESREDKRPTLRDLRESGAIEDAADVVIFPYREAYYLRQQRPRRSAEDAESAYRAKLSDFDAKLSSVAGYAEIVVAKVRRGEAGVRCELHFDGRRTRFTEAGHHV